MATRRRHTKTVQRPATEPKQRSTQEAGKAGPLATDLLDANGAIDLLRTTRPTFYRWLRTGKLRGVKVGRQWRFERAEIERFVKGEEPRIELRTDIGPFVTELKARADALGAPGQDLPEEVGVQHAIEQIIRLGLRLGASDIHIQPLAEEGFTVRSAVVRYRIDGVLHTGPAFDVRLLAPLMQRWKVSSACDPHQARKPQDA
ncbi:MAG TPA: helix-turn-helix domain-containing protein, partial [Vicinamibacterales bacterium]|nr:helix-turn-helix domain-containing protein [Vicinamibacterales bacterium]